jgi:peptidoglycan/xylan/chitin deacetylase (PgdA/CDA1 family)
MKLSMIVKKILANPIYSIKEMYLRVKGKKVYYILMYHRILDKNTSETYMQDGMYVDPDTFRKQMKFLKNKFHVIPLDHVTRISYLEKTIGTDKPFCILTFDDGWKDFYANAYPVLKSNNVSATVFLPTAIIGTEKRFWTEDLAFILSRMEKPEASSINSKTATHTAVSKLESLKGSFEYRMEKAVGELKVLPKEEIDHVLEELAERWRVDPAIQGRSFLSWEEIREMYESSIIRFGSHTSSHRILTTASDDVVMEELILSKRKLVDEGVVSPSFIPFAYPNGNYNDRISEMVEQAGYSLALTTEKGWNNVTSDKGDHFRLKRIGIHQDISSTDAMLACRMYGIY